MASDPLTAVQQLQDVVTTLAPSLRPQILPKGVTYGLDVILSLCKTEEQRMELMALVRSHKPPSKRIESTKSEDENTDREDQESDYLEPQVIGIFDIKNRVFSVEKVQWMHEREAVVHEFARFIELQLENPSVASQIVQDFLNTNGHKKDEIMKAQQCFSAAFALQTLLRAFPKLPIAINGKIIEITSNSDVTTVFAPLFPISTKAKPVKKNCSQNTPAKKPKSKKRKSLT
ncbi:hypothetical protein CCR75_000970 [Bremia lactucae]|uniref:Uncharacterized protein n=1 Tax=Bremia lactucae TaxID=4779 RepID=A0A976FL82_BRELC|nr:hypothetical protein CCR75_000970 [Bremia lactucae]